MSKKDRIFLPSNFEEYPIRVIGTGAWQKTAAALSFYAFGVTFLNPEKASGRPEIEADSPSAAIDKAKIAREYHINPHNIPTLFFGFDIGTQANGVELHKLSRTMKFGNKKKLKHAKEETIHLLSEQDQLQIDWLYAAAILSNTEEISRVASLRIRLTGDPIPKDEVAKAFKDASIIDRNTRLPIIESAKRYRGENGKLTIGDGFSTVGEEHPIRRKHAERIIVGNVMPQGLLNQLAKPESSYSDEKLEVDVVSLNILNGIITT